MLTLSCHCGQIHIELLKKPDYINECNCTLCAKSGAIWGYYHPSEVKVAGATRGYCRADKAEPGVAIQFCPTCGATTHFTLTASAVARFGDSLIGVNMRLADEQELAGVELRYPDGRAWPGEGEFGYVRESRVLGQNATCE